MTGPDKSPYDRQRESGMGVIIDLKGNRFFERLIEISRIEFQRALGALPGTDVRGKRDREIFRRTINQFNSQILIGNIGYFETGFANFDCIGPRNGQTIGNDRNRVGRVGFFQNRGADGYAAGRRSLIGFDQGAFGLQAAMGSRRIDDFERSAVTDSKLLFVQRSLGAASPRLYVEDLETVVADGFDPKRMGNLRILRGVPEIEAFLRQEHFRLRHCLRNQQNKKQEKSGRYQKRSLHSMPPVRSAFSIYSFFRPK